MSAAMDRVYFRGLVDGYECYEAEVPLWVMLERHELTLRIMEAERFVSKSDHPKAKAWCKREDKGIGLTQYMQPLLERKP